MPGSGLEVGGEETCCYFGRVGQVVPVATVVFDFGGRQFWPALTIGKERLKRDAAYVVLV